MPYDVKKDGERRKATAEERDEFSKAAARRVRLDEIREEARAKREAEREAARKKIEPLPKKKSALVTFD